MDIHYRPAKPSDLPVIRNFVDYWLSGRARGRDKTIASNDYFISVRQHSDYLKEKTVLLAFHRTQIVGWAVLSRSAVLVHLLVNGNYRGRGIGKQLIELLHPIKIRSKSDQGTGNPAKFYERVGFKKTLTEKVGKNKNIEIYEHVDY